MCVFLFPIVRAMQLLFAANQPLLLNSSHIPFWVWEPLKHVRKPFLANFHCRFPYSFILWRLPAPGDFYLSGFSAENPVLLKKTNSDRPGRYGSRNQNRNHLACFMMNHILPLLYRLQEARLCLSIKWLPNIFTLFDRLRFLPLWLFNRYLFSIEHACPQTGYQFQTNAQQILPTYVNTC